MHLLGRVLRCFLVIGVAGINLPKCGLCPISSTCTSNIQDEELSENSKNVLIEVQRKNSSCESMYFPPKTVKQNADSLQLKAYCYNDNCYHLSALNVTMKKHNWNKLTLKFKLLDQNYSVCISFELDEGRELFYDCVWTVDDLGDEVMQLQYIVTGAEFTEVGVYYFIPPSCVDKTRKRTLMYFEEINRKELMLHIQKVVSDIDIKEYVLLKCFVNCGEEIKGNCMEDDCLFYKRILITTESKEIVETVDVSEDEGCFYLALQATLSNLSVNGCLNQTPIIKRNKYFFDMMIVVPIVLIILMGFTFALCFTWRMKEGIKYKVNVGDYPTLLLIHDPVHSGHINVVTELATFLSTFCAVDVLLDLNDIEQSETKDPLLWYSSAITRSNYIAVISTPPCKDVQHTPYNGLFAIGLRYVKEQIRCRSSKIQIFSILLPYCDINHIPAEVRNLPCFQLTNDFVSIIAYIHNHKLNWVDKYIGVRKNMLKHVESLLQTNGCMLMNAVENMKNMLLLHSSQDIVTQENVPMFDSYQAVVMSNNSNRSFANSQELDISQTQNMSDSFIELFDINTFNLLGEIDNTSISEELHDNVDSDYNLHNFVL